MTKEILDKLGNLKPCPFCGGKVELKLIGTDYYGCKQSEILCTKCHRKKTQKYVRFAFDYDFIAKLIGEYWNESSIENEWIPCTERLPIENDWYLISAKNGLVGEALYVAERNYFVYQGHYIDTIAWRNLPKAYKEELG